MSEDRGGRDIQSLIKKTLLELRDLKAKLAKSERARTEPIAIIGMACRFPGGADAPAAFWRLLRDGVDATSEVPKDRWDVDVYYDPDPDVPGKISSRRGAFLGEVDGFDPHFFGISPRETASLSPQQRLLLEVTWEALENANQVSDRLFSSPTGVFMGLCGFDYPLWGSPGLDAEAGMDVYGLTGCTLSVAAGRLSYFLGLTGPAMVVDTACSSSLLAVHLAAHSLRGGECDLALAGGVHLMLSPALTVGLSRMRALAPDGRCKTFDAAADGFARGEGCGVVVLKRLSDAMAGGDTILAVIRGSAVNQDGPSGGLTVPSGPSQRAVIRQAVENAGVAPQEVDYVEAHGTGTSLGDPIEIGALETLCSGRPAERPLIVGSVKTNFGHLEAAAGVAGLIKVVLALGHEEIPAHLNFTRPNPHIPWNEVAVVVPTKPMPWRRGGKRRVAGISSFGLSGTNVHVVVEEAARSSEAEARAEAERFELLPISARSPEALRSFAASYEAFFGPGGTGAGASPRDVCYTASARRAHHDHRLAVVARSRQEFGGKLADFLRGEETDIVASSDRIPEHSERLAFVFSGQGADWYDVGRSLLEGEPVFRETLGRCDALVRARAGWSPVEELGRDQARSRLGQPEVAQPTFFALQVGLAALWKSWGIIPLAVVGHSVGEIAAAHVAGALSLEDAVAIVCHRGRLLQRETGQGRMASVELPLPDVRAALAGFDDRVAVGTINSPTTTILSGEAAALEEILLTLERRDVLCRRLNVNFASHSPQMEPYRIALTQAVAAIRPGASHIPIVSTVTGGTLDGARLNAEYWGRNIRQTVLFADAIDELFRQKFATFVEISPHPVLVLPIAQCAARRGIQATAVASLQRGQDERQTLLQALGTLYVHGVAPDWQRLYPASARCVPLPSYPWQRKRYPFRGAASSSREGSVRPRAALRPAAHHLLGTRVLSPLPTFEARFGLESLPFLDDHRISGSIIVPAAVYLEMVVAAARESLGDGDHRIEDFVVHEALLLPDSGSVPVQIIVIPLENGAGSWKIYGAADPSQGADAPWTLHASGTVRRVARAEAVASQAACSLDEVRGRCRDEVSGDAFYRTMAERGLDFGPAFRRIERIRRGPGEALARISALDPPDPAIGRYGMHPVLLDACLHAVGALLPKSVPDADPILLTRLGGFRLVRRASGPLWSHVTLRIEGSEGQETFRGQLRIYDDGGSVIAEADDLVLRRVKRERLTRRAGEGSPDWFYEVAWEENPRESRGTACEAAANVAGPSRVAAALRTRASELAERHGHTRYRALLGDLESLCGDYAFLALRALGWEPPTRNAASLEELAHRLGVAHRHRRLFTRLAGMLAEDGVLAPSATGRRVARVPSPEDADRRNRELRGLYPECAAELEMTGRFGEQLAGVLRGEVDPLHLLFPAGSVASAEALYRESAFAKASNVLTQEAVGAATRGRPAGSTIEILELGAGTGATTSFVLESLPTGGVAYAFTDVSSLFLPTARERFRDRAFLEFQVLDVEKPPALQGFGDRRFDIVLAANVLHATRDLRLALRHVMELLRPGGLLVLLEITGPQRWIDLIFGTTEGWWRFEDLDLRPAHPLLSRRAWLDVLKAEGFDDVAAVPADDEAQAIDQVMVLARRPLPARPPDGRRAAGSRATWWVFADGRGVGGKLAQLVEAEGHRCLLVPAGDRVPAAGAGPSPDVVVHLRSLDACPAVDLDPDRLDRDVATSCGSVLDLVKTLAGREPARSTRIWIVTRGAQRTGREAEPLAPSHAPLWGLGRVLALEHPALWGGLIDLGEPSEDDATRLLAEIYGRDDEDQIALRDGRRYVARLVRALSPKTEPIRLRSDASYLVTGGLGGLGLLVARWLAERGARNLVLVGRTALPVRSRWNDPGTDAATRRRIDAVRSLEEGGVRVVTVSADLADSDQMSRLFDRFGQDEPPLRGIVHAAGIVDFRPLAKMGREHLEAVLRPKVRGTWILHRMTAGMPLEVFALFSSTTGLWGSSAMAHYAAANAFLDAFAHYRRSLGLPATSIDWGLWEQTGISKAIDAGGYARFGLNPMPSDRALDALGRVVASRAAQSVVADVDWSVLKPAYAAKGNRPLLSRIEVALPGVASKAAAGPSLILDLLRAACPEDRRELLGSIIEGDVARVLGLDRSKPIDVDRGFFGMGMDSLTAVELKRRLEARIGESLPDTLTFNYPTVRALTEFLSARVLPSDAPLPQPESEPATEEELISLLAEKIRDTDGGDVAP